MLIIVIELATFKFSYFFLSNLGLKVKILKEECDSEHLKLKTQLWIWV